MVKGKILSLVLIFLVLSIISVMLVANVSDMNSDYAENSTFAETGERSFRMVNMLSVFIIPLAIILSVLFIFIVIKWAFSQAGVHY